MRSLFPMLARAIVRMATAAHDLVFCVCVLVLSALDLHRCCAHATSTPMRLVQHNALCRLACTAVEDFDLSHMDLRCDSLSGVQRVVRTRGENHRDCIYRIWTRFVDWSARRCEKLIRASIVRRRQSGSTSSSRPGARGVLPLLRFDNVCYGSAWRVAWRVGMYSLAWAAALLDRLAAIFNAAGEYILSHFN